jgi:hypothetical protein
LTPQLKRILGKISRPFEQIAKPLFAGRNFSSQKAAYTTNKRQEFYL